MINIILSVIFYNYKKVYAKKLVWKKRLKIYCLLKIMPFRIIIHRPQKSRLLKISEVSNSENDVLFSYT